MSSRPHLRGPTPDPHADPCGFRQGKRSRRRRLAIAVIAMLAVNLQSCASTPARQEPGLPAATSGPCQSYIVSGKRLDLSTVSHGTDVRGIQASEDIALTIRLSDSGGDQIAYREFPDGEWYHGKDVGTRVSKDDQWIFLFHIYDPPIRGRQVYRDDLPGWYVIPPAELPPDQIINYRCSLIAGIDTTSAHIYDAQTMQEIGFNAHYPPLLPEVAISTFDGPMKLDEVRTIVP